MAGQSGGVNAVILARSRRMTALRQISSTCCFFKEQVAAESVFDIEAAAGNEGGKDLGGVAGMRPFYACNCYVWLIIN